MSACEASWLPALWDAEKEVTTGLGQSSRRGEHFLPQSHAPLEKGCSHTKPEPLRSVRGRRLRCPSPRTAPSLTPKTKR